MGIDLGLGFIKEPEDVVAKRNQPVMLDCSAFSNNEYGHVNVTWYHKVSLVHFRHPFFPLSQFSLQVIFFSFLNLNGLISHYFTRLSADFFY